MKHYYSLEISMLGENERSFELDQEIGEALGFAEDDIDEREVYRMTAAFVSDTIPSVMNVNVTQLLKRHPEIFYIDIIHRPIRRGYESLPDRTVIWGDGRIQNYVGRIIYEEVK